MPRTVLSADFISGPRKEARRTASHPEVGGGSDVSPGFAAMRAFHKQPAFALEGVGLSSLALSKDLHV
jgi:hypothetical protein